MSEQTGTPEHPIELQTDQGEHVVNAVLPPFQEHPDVLIWGQRFFIFHKEVADGLIYREAFTYSIPPGHTDHNPDADGTSVPERRSYSSRTIELYVVEGVYYLRVDHQIVELDVEAEEKARGMAKRIRDGTPPQEVWNEHAIHRDAFGSWSPAADRTPIATF